MSDKVKAEPPKVELATKDWTLRELMDTERRIEKAFHEQSQYLTQQQAISNEKIDNVQRDIASQTRWMIGLIVPLGIGIILAVLFKG